MATMSSYELKVTGLLKGNVDAGPAGQASQHFRTLFPDPREAPPAPDSWVAKFLPESDTTLKRDATVREESWEIRIDSVLAKDSQVAAGSTLNGEGVPVSKLLDHDTKVASRTILSRGSILKPGTILKNEQYKVISWRAGTEDVPEWSTEPGADPQATGKYGLMSFHAVVAVTRPGALGEHWGRQTAQDDLEFFYNYKTAVWFKRLIADLIRFNKKWSGAEAPAENVLEEEIRIRDLKWYCGNGGGP